MAGELRFLAMVGNDLGQPKRAVKLVGAADAWRRKVGGQVPAAFIPFTDPGETAAKVMDLGSVECAWAGGAAMTWTRP